MSAEQSKSDPATSRAAERAMTVRRVRLALGFVALGLMVQLVTTLFWSPLMFVLFSVFGVSAVGVGALYFLWIVWRHIDRAHDEAGS